MSSPELSKQERQQKYFEAGLQRAINADILLGEYGLYLLEMLADEMERWRDTAATVEFDGSTYDRHELANQVLLDLEDWVENDPRKEFI